MPHGSYGPGGESPPLPTPMQTIYADHSVDYALAEINQHAGMHIVNTGRPDQPI